MADLSRSEMKITGVKLGWIATKTKVCPKRRRNLEGSFCPQNMKSGK